MLFRPYALHIASRRFCSEAHLRLKLPFFSDSLLGAVHLHGPLGLEARRDKRGRHFEP